MDTMMNFADSLIMEDNIKPLMDLIEQIMSIPEESLNEDNVDVIGGMINGAFTPKMREDAIKDVINSFEEQHLSRAEAQNLVNQSKDGIKEALDDLEASPHKRAILDAAFDFFYDTFDKALDRYHSYDFELPIKLDKGGRAPTYAHETDACADVYALKDTILPAHSLSTIIPTGLRMALPEGWVAKIAPRSSIGAKTGLRLSNSIGIIDADYRGEIGVLYDNFSDSDYEIKAGDRIAQIWVEPVHRFKPVEVDILSATERGEGGFGSSGK